MKRYVMTFTALSVALVVAVPLVAQSSKKGKSTAGTPLKVKVTQVNDRRTSGHFAQLGIGLDLPGVPSAQVAATRVVLLSAVDDTGKTLLPSDSQEPGFDQNMRPKMSRDNSASTPTSISLTLDNPARNATRVRELSGEIELYMPEKDPNATAVFLRFRSSVGKPLSHKALKASGVEVTLISRPQLEVEKKRLGEQKRKEGKAQGLDAESLTYAVSSFLESFFAPEEGDVVLKVKDPNKRIHEFEYVDAAGEPKRVNSRLDESGMTVLSTWGEKPAEDWGLRINLKTPKTIVRHTFKLTDVTLP